MKNINLFLVLFMVIVLVGACISDPHPPPPEQPAQVAQADPPPTPQTPPSTPIDSYNRHSSGVILNGAQQYTVQTGDILAQIARRFYEDGSYYPLIMLVSDDVVADPDEIEPGMRLTIPPLRENLNDPRARQSINRYLLQIAVIEDQRGRRETASLMRNHTN